MKISQIRERTFAMPLTSCPAMTNEAVMNIQARAPATALGNIDAADCYIRICTRCFLNFL